MITGSGRYDAELQMFVVDRPREPDITRLRFLRWLGEQGKLEHQTAGRSAGAFAGDLAPEPPTAA
jgi:hypothetical protein